MKTLRPIFALALACTLPLLADTTVTSSTPQPLNVSDPGQVITSGTVEVQSGSTGVLQAGTAVKLEPGFHAFNGSGFHAFIYGVAIITSPGTAKGTAGSAFTYQITGSNIVTSYSATGLTAAGLSINASTGLITGTLTGTGTYSITLMTTNAFGTYQTAMLLGVSGNTTTQSDGDGVPDAIEVQLGTNPNATASSDTNNTSTLLKVARPL